MLINCKGKFSLGIFFVALSFSSLHSQTYRPLAVEGATWIYEGWGDFQNYQTYYHIKGDTAIKSIRYKQVLVNNNLAGYIRDDTTARKVYSSPSLSNLIFEDCEKQDSLEKEQEILFCDFSYRTGDTIDICKGGYNKLPINYIGKEILFGEELRVWSWKDNITSVDDINLVEGIGSLDGFLGSLYTEIAAGGGIYRSDYCISENGQCTSSNKNLLEDSEIKIYPNPVMGLLSIETEKAIKNITIYDISGRVTLKRSE